MILRGDSLRDSHVHRSSTDPGGLTPQGAAVLVKTETRMSGDGGRVELDGGTFI
jgi:hypothetical protein